MATYTFDLRINAKVLELQPTDNFCIAKKGMSVILAYVMI